LGGRGKRWGKYGYLHIFGREAGDGGMHGHPHPQGKKIKGEEAIGKRDEMRCSQWVQRECLCARQYKLVKEPRGPATMTGANVDLKAGRGLFMEHLIEGTEVCSSATLVPGEQKH